MVQGSDLVFGPLLDLLLRGVFVTATEAAAAAGLQAGQLHEALDRLSMAGCVFDRHPQRGVRLVRSGLSAWSDYLAWRDVRRGDGRGRKIEVYGSVASTQDVVRRVIEAEGERADAAVAVADEQARGRGRLGRTWAAAAGTSVLVSRADVRTTRSDRRSADRLLIAATVAVADAIEKAVRPAKLDVRIRWPNDLMADGRKLAGILVERFEVNGCDAAVIGVGVNVTMTAAQFADAGAELTAAATSLAMLGCGVDRLRVLAGVIDELDAAAAGDDMQNVADQWRRRNSFADELVRFQCDGKMVRGSVVDVDLEHGLMVRTQSGHVVALPSETTTIL